MRFLVAIFIASFVPAWANAQTATVRGFVQDDSNGEALFGVNVVLTAPDGSIAGSATDNEGFYIIRQLAPGTYELRGTYIGFEPYVETITLAADQILTKNFALKLDERVLDELVVEDEREGGAVNVNAGLQTIRPQDIDLIPTPDVSADLVNYLTTLPGVVASGDRGGQLFIRGGEPTQNLVQIDGMLLYQPFHIVGFYSAFPSDIIKVSDVYAGGYGSKFGGRLSSVIDISTRNGNNRHVAGAATLAPFVTSGRLEGPLLKNKASFFVSARQSVIEQGASKIIDQNLPFRFGDVFGKLHFSLGQNSQGSVSGLRTFDRGVIGVSEEVADLDAPDQNQISWSNTAGGVRYILLPASLPMFAEVLLSYSQLDQEFGPLDNPVRTTTVEEFGATVNVKYFTKSSQVDWGLFLRNNTLDNMLGGQFQNVQSEREFVTEAGMYLEPIFNITPSFTVHPGVRLHAFPSKSETFVEPRLRIVWDKQKHRLSSALGIYHQEIVGLNDRRDAGNIYTAWTTAPLQNVPQAQHAIVGYTYTAARGLDLSLEGYYKNLRNLTIPEWSAFPRFSVNVQPADGSVVGFDARASFERRWFNGFVSYGFSEVEYRATGESIAIWYGDSTLPFNPAHDRRHQVAALSNVQAAGFNFSVRWQFGSGLPFNESIGFDTYVLVDGETDVRTDPGTRRVLYGRPYTGRLPAYHRLDISLDKKFSINRGSITLQAGAINAYDRSNLFYLDLFTLDRSDQLPLIPSFGIKIELE